MSLRSDPTVWFNLFGVVAVYQPIGAPGPLLARYNQAHGGDNRYLAVPGALPAFNSATGWTFTAASQHRLDTGVTPTSGYSMMVRFSGVSNGGCLAGTYKYTAPTGGFAIFPNVSSKVYYYGGNELQVAPAATGGVLAIAGTNVFRNGVDEGDLNGAIPTGVGRVFIGSNSNQVNAHIVENCLAGSIQSVMICARALSPAEAWYASRQMAYCHVNPDWSAWGRRRRYYYAPAQAAAGAVGIYGKRGAVALPGGVRIGTVDHA